VRTERSDLMGAAGWPSPAGPGPSAHWHRVASGVPADCWQRPCAQTPAFGKLEIVVHAQKFRQKFCQKFRLRTRVPCGGSEHAAQSGRKRAGGDAIPNSPARDGAVVLRAAAELTMHRRSGRVRKRRRTESPPSSPSMGDDDAVGEFDDGPSHPSSSSASSDAAEARKLAPARFAFATKTRVCSKPPAGATPAVPRSAPDGQTWPDAHAPQTAPALVMAAVTVNKLRKWMAAAVSKNPPGHPRLLILTGPPGTGKSSAVRVLSKELGVEIAEWHAPLPTGETDSTTRALLDSLQAFLVGARYPSLVSPSEAPPSQRLLLIDDIPLSLSDFHSHARTGRLTCILANAAESSSTATVVIISDSNKARARSARVLGLSLFESPNVQVLNVNPATDNNMARAIEAVTRRENRQLPPDSLNALIAASEGDIRAALNTLHMYATCPEVQGPDLAQPAGPPPPVGHNGRPRAPRRARVAAVGPPAAPPVTLDHVPGIGSDASLDTFHAVSKVLNNKRLSTGGSKYDAEQVLGDARAEPAAFVAFLHQNFPRFFTSAADAAHVLELLSDSAALLEWRQDDALRSSLGDCAASVVTRGFLLHNTEPKRTGWRPVQGPECFAVRREASDCLHRAREAFDSHRPGSMEPARALATDVLPYMELMGRAGAPTSRALRGGTGDPRFAFRRTIGNAHRLRLEQPGASAVSAVELAMLDEEEVERSPTPRRTDSSAALAGGRPLANCHGEAGAADANAELVGDTINDWDD
jgi:hypothetical protein